MATVHCKDSAPLVSIILPVYNGQDCLKRAVDGLRASSFQDFELIVVDDASCDATPAVIAEVHPDRALRLEHNGGPFVARKLGVQVARGALLFFTDADVCLRPDALERLVRRCDDPGVGGVIGVYSREHPDRGLCSNYKNAWVRFSYLRAPARVAWFFTAIGLMRRSVWEHSGGFSGVHSNDDPEDLWFGLHQARHGVQLVKDNQAEAVHSKTFTLTGILRNDARRAFRLARRALATHETRVCQVLRHGFANIDQAFVLSAVLMPLLLLVGLASAFQPAFLAALGVALALYGAMNAPFYAHSTREYGVGRAVAFAGILALDQLTCGTAMAAAGLDAGCALGWRRLRPSRAHGGAPDRAQAVGLLVKPRLLRLAVDRTTADSPQRPQTDDGEVGRRA